MKNKKNVLFSEEFLALLCNYRYFSMVFITKIANIRELQVYW